MTGPAGHGIAARRAGEIARWLLLGAVATWLLHPFATNRQIGAGDALWYANMLADYCLQLRAGVFPVFAGQTEFAFNGAVYPLRVAPLYQHLGGILDLLTGRQLGWFALQHLCVIVCGVAGIFACYFALCALAPTRRWTAAALATLYLSCPGVLGTIYTQDLYMTWMTIPFVPLTVYGAVRAFQKDDLAAQLCLAAGLAALWLAHSPIALWMTLVAGAVQLIRLLWVHRSAAAWKRAALGCLLMVALGHYPFISLAGLQASGRAASHITSGLEHPESIANTVHEVFPAVLQPVSEHARAGLSDLQLGYGLWLVLLGAVAGCCLVGRWEIRALLGCCAGLLALLLPMPGNAWLWAHVPEQITRITYYWPMQRFFILLAMFLAAAGQLADAGWSFRSQRLTRFIGIPLICACAWSLWESRQFIAAGHDRTASAELTALHQRPENRLLMSHAYGLFPALPAYFSNGVMDARDEARLLDHTTLAPMAPAPSSLPSSTWSILHGHTDENPGILKLEPTLSLSANKRYELSLDFAPRTYTGVLQLTGRGFFREYVLPTSGQPLAFGSAAGSAHTLSLWTTLPEGDELTLRFIPTAAGETPANYADFGRYNLREVPPGDMPVNVTALIPFRAAVNSPSLTWLETPRMFQFAYLAWVDGTPVEPQRSPQGLTMIEVPPGNHQVELVFHGTTSLRLSYALTAAAWISLILAAGFSTWRRLRN